MAFLAGALATGAVVAWLAAARLRVHRSVMALGEARHAGAVRTPRSGASIAMAKLPLVKRLGGPQLADKIAAAGWTAQIEDVLAAKAVCALGAVLLAAVLSPQTFFVAPLAGAGGFVLPDLLLARSARVRHRRMDGQMVQFLDLLAAASSAGLAAPAAIGRAARGVRGPLAEELATSAAAVGIGARWRDELRALADRLGLTDLRAAVTVIARTETLGSSLAGALRDLAADVREMRRARSAERARTAPVKMLFPLVFMILPAFLLLTVVPVLIATLRSLH